MTKNQKIALISSIVLILVLLNQNNIKHVTRACKMLVTAIKMGATPEQAKVALYACQKQVQEGRIKYIEELYENFEFHLVLAMSQD